MIGNYLAFLRHEMRENPAQFSPETLKRLELLKFKCREHHHVGFNVVYSALIAYKNIYGHVRVPPRFVVPENDSAFPESSWGLKLGNTALKPIRHSGIFAEHREKLEALGVNFEVKHQVGFDVIYSALVAFKSVHGHVKVPVRFVVPENDSAYPESSWGLKLGSLVKHICHSGTHAEHRDKFAALGVVSKKWTVPAAIKNLV